MTDLHDVIVVGAGPGGSAAAYYLASRGIRTLLLDKADFPRDKTCGDGLSPRALAVLADMSLVADMLPHGQVIRSLEIIAPNGRGLDARVPVHPGLPDYSLVVPRYILDDLVRRRAVDGGAAFEAGVHVTGLDRENGSARVIGQRDGKTVKYRAKLALLATGVSTRLLIAAGVLDRTPPVMVAARAYFEGFKDLPEQTQFRFDGVPLPGYGWLFPVSPTCANVGAGYYAGEARVARRMPPSPRVAFERFVAHPPVRQVLAGTRQVGPLKSYPLRLDFLSAPTYAERLLVVGEAAGLVNPLTGEGIDYALESGQMAAESAALALADGDFSREALAAYDRQLRERFQSMFAFCTSVRDHLLHPRLLDWLIAIARRREDLKMLLINIALSNQAVTTVSPLKVASILFQKKDSRKQKTKTFSPSVFGEHPRP